MKVVILQQPVLSRSLLTCFLKKGRRKNSKNHNISIITIITITVMVIILKIAKHSNKDRDSANNNMSPTCDGQFLGGGL